MYAGFQNILFTIFSESFMLEALPIGATKKILQSATYVHSAFLCESIDNIDYVNEIGNNLTT